MEITLTDLSHKLDAIQRTTLIGVKTVLDLEEAVQFTGFSRGHLYRLTSERQIPHFKKNRKLYFKKTDLEAWLCETRVKTEAELQSEAETYVSTHKRQ